LCSASVVFAQFANQTAAVAHGTVGAACEDDAVDGRFDTVDARFDEV